MLAVDSCGLRLEKLWAMLQTMSSSTRLLSMLIFQRPEKYRKAMCYVATYPIIVARLIKSGIKEGGTVPSEVPQEKVLFSER